MLYDEHRKLGREHARAGMLRYHWGDPHLQRAYDQGFDRAKLERDWLLEDQQDRFRSQQIPGLPGKVRF